MNKKKKKRDLPLSFEESLRRQCPALFELQESSRYDEMPIARTGGRIPKGMQPHDPFDQSSGMDDPDDQAGNDFLNPGGPKFPEQGAQYAGAQRGRFDYPDANPNGGQAKLGSMAQRLAMRPSSQGVKAEIIKNLDKLNPQQLDQIQKMILRSFGTTPLPGVPGGAPMGGSGAYGGPQF